MALGLSSLISLGLWNKHTHGHGLLMNLNCTYLYLGKFMSWHTEKNHWHQGNRRGGSMLISVVVPIWLLIIQFFHCFPQFGYTVHHTYPPNSSIHQISLTTCETYNALGHLICTACNCQVKSDRLWKPHLLSRSHKEVSYILFHTDDLHVLVPLKYFTVVISVYSSGCITGKSSRSQTTTLTKKS